MTYFKRRRGILDHIRLMDTRVLHASIDPPVWWHAQRAVVAERETVVDLSAHPLGDCDDSLAKTGIRVVMADNRPFVARIAEQHGIRGLALSGRCELRLPNPVDQVDILVAHFGRPPTLIGHGRHDKVVKMVADDRPRQVELIRLLGQGIDRVEVEAPDGTSLVQVAFPGHTRGGEASPALK